MWGDALLPSIGSLLLPLSHVSICYALSHICCEVHHLHPGVLPLSGAVLRNPMRVLAHCYSARVHWSWLPAIADSSSSLHWSLYDEDGSGAGTLIMGKSIHCFLCSPPDTSNVVNFLTTHPSHTAQSKAKFLHCVHTAHAEAGILTQEYLSPV